MTRGGGSLGCKGLSCDKPRGFCPFSPGCLVKGLKLCKILPGHFSQQCIQGKINSCFVLFLLSLEDQAMTDSLQCTSSPQLPSQPVDRPSPGTVCSALSVCLSVFLFFFFESAQQGQRGSKGREERILSRLNTGLNTQLSVGLNFTALR